MAGWRLRLIEVLRPFSSSTCRHGQCASRYAEPLARLTDWRGDGATAGTATADTVLLPHLRVSGDSGSD